MSDPLAYRPVGVVSLDVEVLQEWVDMLAGDNPETVKNELQQIIADDRGHAESEAEAYEYWRAQQ